MRLLKSFLARSAICFFLSSPLTHAAVLPAGSGHFLFANDAVSPGRPVSVWYYKPASLDSRVKVMIVMPGADRRGDQYRDQWIGHAEKHKLLVVVPEFADKYFSIDEYQFGNVTDPRREHWLFRTIEHLFDDLRRRDGLAVGKYYLFGHSAGAQFVHRFMLFMPTSRVDIAFAANAGAYSMPVYASSPASAFPMRLDPALVSEQQRDAVFARRLVVMLGEEDIDPESEGLPRSPEAMEQGKNRYERGQAFFRLAQRQAAARRVPFRWKLLSVPRVGHSNAEMSDAAVRYLFE